MPAQRIDEIIDVAAIKEQAGILRDELTKSQQKLIEVYDLIQKYKSASFSESAKDAKALAAALNESAKATQNATKANADFEKVLQQQAKTREANAKAAKAQAQEEQAVIKLIDQEAASERKRIEEQKKSEAQSRKQKDAYEQLKIQYNQTAAQAKAFGIQLGVESKEFLETAGAAQKYYTQLLTVEKAVGQGQRQVGQYENATRGLNASINQITRELPAFTYSVQTGFLAISNNLPIFFDEISKINASNKELAAQGKQTQSIFKSIAQGIFSFGTILSVGVTLLTVFGKEIGEFITSMFKSREAIDATKESVKILGEALASSDYTNAVSTVNELTTNIQLAKEGFISKEKALKQYNETIGKTTGEVKTLDEAEQSLTRNGDAYIKMTLLKAAANLALGEAAKKALEAEQNRLKQAEEFLTTGDKLARFGASNVSAPGFVPGLQQQATGIGTQFSKAISDRRKNEAVKAAEDEADTLEGIAKKFQEDAARISKQFGFDFFGGQFDEKNKNDALQKIKDALFEAQRLELEGRLQTAQLVAENEQKTFAERIAARQEQGRIELALINLQAAYEISKENVTAQEKRNIRTKASQERIAKEAETNNALRDLLQAQSAFELDIIATLADKRAKDAANADKIAGKIQERAKNIEQQSQIELTNLDKRYAEEQRIALENYRIGNLSKEEYEQTLLDIQVKYADLALQAQIAAAKARLKLLNVGTKEYADAQKAIADAELARLKLVEDYEKKSLEKRFKNTQNFLSAVQTISQNLTSAISAIFDIGYERQIAQLETQRNEIEKTGEAEIDNINNSTLSAEEKEKRIQIAKATTDAKLQQIERRQREEELRRAKFQKSIDILNIITGTAQAVVAALGMKPYTPLNIAIAAGVGALGAAQLAAAIAAPLPKFERGTEHAPGGWALTDEEGPEGYIEPGGKTYLGNTKPTLRWLKPGTKIIPHDELNKAMFNDMIVNTAGMLNKPEKPVIIVQNDSGSKEIVKAIRSKKSVVNNHISLGRIEYLEKNVYH